MRYPRSARQAEFIALANDLARRIAPRAAEHDRRGTIAAESIADLVAARYHLLTLPAELGGLGGDMLDFVLAQNALAKGDEAVAVGINMHLMSVANAVQQPGGWPQQLMHRVVREIVEHGALLNSIATEPELGSPAGGGAPRTIARPVPGGWLISGHKTWATLSSVLTFYIVLAAVEDPQRDDDLPAEVAQFLVRRGPGTRIERTWDTMGMRATGSDDLWLEDAFVPDENVIARRPLGSAAAAAPGGSYFALGVSAVNLAIAEQARDFTVHFAATRAPTGLGRPIGTVQSVAHKIAHMEILLLSARTLLLDTAQEFADYPQDRPKLASRIAATKYTVVNSAIEVVDLALRVVGGLSLFRSQPLERYYRNVRAALNNPPIDDRALDLIGKAALTSATPDGGPPP